MEGQPPLQRERLETECEWTFGLIVIHIDFERKDSVVLDADVQLGQLVHQIEILARPQRCPEGENVIEQ